LSVLRTALDCIHAGGSMPISSRQTPLQFPGRYCRQREPAGIVRQCNYPTDRTLLMYRSNQQDCSYSVLVCGIRMLRALVDRKKYDQSCLFQTTHTWCLYLAYGVNSLSRYLKTDGKHVTATYGTEYCTYVLIAHCDVRFIIYTFGNEKFGCIVGFGCNSCICVYRSNRNRTEHMKPKVTILVLMNAEDRL